MIIFDDRDINYDIHSRTCFSVERMIQSITRTKCNVFERGRYN